jgi:ketosteroid isomerase-like protein
MGESFHVVLFKDDDGTTKVSVAFEGRGQIATLQVNLLAKGDIAFGSNSWRCESYADIVRDAIYGFEHARSVGR